MDIYEEIKNDKVMKNIYLFVLENGATSPATFKEKIKSKRGKKINQKFLYEKIKKLEESGLFERKFKEDNKRRGERILYDLKKDRYKNIDHLLFFDDIRQENAGVLYGDGGDFAVKGLYTRTFFNNHSLYGLPNVINPKNNKNNLTDYERENLFWLLYQIDSAFNGIKKIKLIYELRKKIEDEKWLSDCSFPYGMVSEKLLMQNLIFLFSKALYELLEPDSHKKESYEFLFELREEVYKLAKKHKLESSDNSDTIFRDNMLFAMLFASDPTFAMEYSKNPSKYYAPFIDMFNLIKKKNWFYNKKKLKSFERIEQEILQEAIKQKDERKKFYPKKDNPLIYKYEKDTSKPFNTSKLKYNESLALLSTSSMVGSSESKRDIDLKLVYFFDSEPFITEDFKTIKDSWEKVYVMCSLILYIEHISIDDTLLENMFKQHKKINEFFNPEEILMMITIIKDRSWKNIDECEYKLWVKLYEENGAWHDKWFTSLSKEFIKRLKKGEDYKTLYKEYHNNAVIKNKQVAFEKYLKARIYFEVEKSKGIIKKR